jgi:hypothetical protein
MASVLRRKLRRVLFCERANLRRGVLNARTMANLQITFVGVFTPSMVMTLHWPISPTNVGHERMATPSKFMVNTPHECDAATKFGFFEAHNFTDSPKQVHIRWLINFLTGSIDIELSHRIVLYFMDPVRDQMEINSCSCCKVLALLWLTFRIVNAARPKPPANSFAKRANTYKIEPSTCPT